MARVIEGHPTGQTYGLGAPWTNDNHHLFNRGKVCGEGSPCLLPTVGFAAQHFSVGPPIVMHLSDWTRVAATWSEFAPSECSDQLPPACYEILT